ncbi:thermonuclease family protein [Labrys sp. LIt4]|uniref:thermonuclease family protein n=1 Tax=Labrys sp. LIt4 TaxID=2821355 RepID=UPI001ADFB1EF|nr:thermonuclease family protein [Labrys sp. LIt4]MBP0581474.1 thermonuclease family protein [Labrys sp. LIt4]
MKSVLRIVFGILLLTAPAGAATYEAVDGNRIIVLDGDTVALPCKKPGRGCAERVRLRDIDAPEVFHPDCAEGLQQGLKAKARLVQLIRGKAVYVERDGHRDLYGRTLGALRIGNPSGLNAGMQLVREDLARPWKGGAAAREERRLWWCGPQMPDH